MIFQDALLVVVFGFCTFIFFITLESSLNDHNPNAPRGSWDDRRADIKASLVLTVVSGLLTIVGLLGWGWGVIILPLLLLGVAGVFIAYLVQLGFRIYRYLRF